MNFILTALQIESAQRGNLRGYRPELRNLLRRLALDFHHQIRDFEPQVPPQNSWRDDVIVQATNNIRPSPFYSFNQVLAEYLIRILKQVQPGDYIPIAMLLCPHASKSVHCGGFGCQHKSFPTIRNLRRFAAALPQHRIRFGNSGQPIDNIMVANIREKCAKFGCPGYGSLLATIAPSTGPTPAPSCYPATIEEGRSTAGLLNFFAEAAMALGTLVVVFNLGGYSLKKRFFPYLSKCITCGQDGVHISLYSRRFALAWRTIFSQGNRITGIVATHSRIFSELLTRRARLLADAAADPDAANNDNENEAPDSTIANNTILQTLCADNQINYVANKYYDKTDPEYDEEMANMNSRRSQVHGDNLRRRAERYEEAWNQNFAQLVEFRRVHGHTNVPQASGPLGLWVMNQRQRSGQGMTPDRHARLESIGFVWNTWNESFRQLELYLEEYGHTNVPTAYNQQNGQTPLGTWVNHQRQLQGMTPERHARLESIGFVWNAGEARWNESFRQLELYLEEYGHTNVPQRDGPLGIWVMNQRQRQGMTPERHARLESIGFAWNAEEARWDENYQQLVLYLEEHHHTNVPQREGPLGTWVKRQRGTSRPDEGSVRWNSLNDLGFWDN